MTPNEGGLKEKKAGQKKSMVALDVFLKRSIYLIGTTRTYFTLSSSGALKRRLNFLTVAQILGIDFQSSKKEKQL